MPSFTARAITWPMTFSATFKTERIPTLAANIDHPIVLILNALITALIRTPSHIPIIIRVRFEMEFHVRGLIFIFQ